MTFTQEQIKGARAKVKSGADFPREIQEFKAMGITSYEFSLANGVCTYFGGGQSLQTASDYANHPYDALRVSTVVSAQKLQDALIIHQAGKTDFPTFCVQAVRAGITGWRCDLVVMTCTYLADTRVILVEKIPAV